MLPKLRTSQLDRKFQFRFDDLTRPDTKCQENTFFCFSQNKKRIE
jgi:hypothetical protein